MDSVEAAGLEEAADSAALEEAVLVAAGQAAVGSKRGGYGS